MEEKIGEVNPLVKDGIEINVNYCVSGIGRFYELLLVPFRTLGSTVLGCEIYSRKIILVEHVQHRQGV